MKNTTNTPDITQVTDILNAWNDILFDFDEANSEENLAKIEVVANFIKAHNCDVHQIKNSLEAYARDSGIAWRNEYLAIMSSPDTVKTYGIVKSIDYEMASVEIYILTESTIQYDDLSNNEAHTTTTEHETLLLVVNLPNDVAVDLLENYHDSDGTSVELGKPFSGEILESLFANHVDALVEFDTMQDLKFIEKKATQFIEIIDQDLSESERLEKLREIETLDDNEYMDIVCTPEHEDMINSLFAKFQEERQLDYSRPKFTI